MSDFLSRLIDRSAGTAAIALPVIAPLFGAAPDSASLESPAASPVAGAVRGARATEARLSASGDPASLGVPTAALEQAPTATSAEPAAPAAPPAAPLRPAAAGGLRRPSEATADLQPPPGPALADQDPPDVAVERTAIASSQAVRAQEARGVVPRQAARLLAPAAAPGTPAIQALPEEGSRSQDGPVVVVNIARIEVKAPQPAAPAPQPARRRQAAVSLEEYLKPGRRAR